MIPIFRRLRKQLANDNKPIQYLRYAIGEIVLVVIGILIALSINNWNQDLQNKKLEQATLKALLNEFQDNRNSISDYLENIVKMRKFGDTLRKLIGPKLTSLNKYEVLRFIGEVSETTKCIVTIDVLGDVQSSGRLNLLSNVEVRKAISNWSSHLKELQSEEFDWAQEFSNLFITYTHKWMQWDDVDYVFNGKDSLRYYQSRFDVDPRRMLQQPKFENVINQQYWRISRVRRRTVALLEHTDALINLIEKDLK